MFRRTKYVAASGAILLSSVFVGWQLHSGCHIYFSRSVTVSTEFLSADLFPELILCAHIGHIARLDRIWQRYPKFSRNVTYMSKRFFISAIESISENWTITDWDFFTEGTHKISVEHRCNDSNWTSWKSGGISFWGLNRCVTFPNEDMCKFYSGTGEGIIEIQIELLNGGDVVLPLYKLRELLFSFRIQSPNTPKDNLGLSYKLHKLNIDYRLLLGNVRRLLLEPPFPTNCEHYSKRGFRSQDECVSECSLVNYRKNYGENILPCNFPIGMSHWKDRNVTFDCQLSSSLDRFVNVTSICREQICKLVNCEQDSYTLESIWEEKNDPASGNVTIIDISRPLSPIMYFIYQPRRELVEFINFFASACDLWVDLVTIFGIVGMIQTVSSIWRKKNKVTWIVTKKEDKEKLAWKDVVIRMQLDAMRREMDIMKAQLSSEIDEKIAAKMAYR